MESKLDGRAGAWLGVAWRPGVVLALSLCGLIALTGGCSKESKKARHLERGGRFFEAGEWEKAKIEYLNAFRLDADDPLLIERLGRVFYEVGDWQRAFAFLKKTIELAPDNLEARAKLASIYLAGREPDKAREEALAVLARRPSHPEAVLILADAALAPEKMVEVRQHILTLQTRAGDSSAIQMALGTLAMRSRDLPAAEAAFRRAQALDPKASGPHLALARWHAVRNELDKADEEFRIAASLPDAKPLGRLQWAEFKVRTQKLDEAKKILDELTTRWPDFAMGWTLMAEIALAEKRTDDATKFINVALSRKPDHFDALLLRARMKLVANKPAEAVQEFERMSKLFPRAPEVFFQMALAQLLNNDLTRAVAALNQALTLDPHHTEATMLLANLDLRRGEADNAASAMLELIRRQTNNVRARYVLAEAFQAQSRLDDAASVYREIIARFPAETEAPYRLGQVLRAQRRPAEARKAFQRCLEINTNHLPATVQLIELDLAATNHAAALTRVEAEIARQTNSPSLHVLRAMVYRAQKDDARAEGALKRAIEVDPTFTPAYLELARLYVAGNRAAEAIRNLEDALEKDAKNLSAYLLLGSIHERAGAYAAARDAYERALKVNPSFVIALNNLAYLYAEHLQDPGKGYEHALKARRLAPREPFIADTLGWIHYHRGEYAEAVNLLQESVEGMRSERDRTEVLYHLGMAQYMMGLEAPARVSLQRALQNPDFTGRAEAERRLAILDARLNPADKNAVADLRRRVAENPKDIITLTRLGDVLGAQGDAAGAREAYEQALKLNPRAFGPTVRLAELYAGPLREPEKAMELAKAARSLAPGDPQVAWTLGRLAFQARDYPWSHSLLQEAAARLSTRPDFLYDLALAQYSVGRVAEAERNMQQALQLPGAFSQTNAARWFVTLTALVRNPTQAPALEAQVRQMLAANGDYVPGLMALGLIEEQRKNPAEARKAYEKALSIYPQFLPASVRLAGLYAEHFGELQRAYDVALKARTAQPEDPELAKVLGKIVYRRKDYPYAVRLFQETTRKVPSDAEAFYYLGLAHHQLQQPAEARQALHQALGLQLEPVLAREANRLLAELK